MECFTLSLASLRTGSIKLWKSGTATIEFLFWGPATEKRTSARALADSACHCAHSARPLKAPEVHISRRDLVVVLETLDPNPLTTMSEKRDQDFGSSHSMLSMHATHAS
jgi:hypothetical protein